MSRLDDALAWVAEALPWLGEARDDRLRSIRLARKTNMQEVIPGLEKEVAELTALIVRART